MSSHLSEYLTDNFRIQSMLLQDKVELLEAKCFDDSATIIRQLDEKKKLKR